MAITDLNMRDLRMGQGVEEKPDNMQMAGTTYEEFMQNIRDVLMETFAKDLFDKTPEQLTEDEIIEINLLIDDRMTKTGANKDTTMMADGGRVGLQTGGMPEPTQVTQTLPSPLLTGITTAFTEKLKPLIGQEIPTTSYTGEQFVAGIDPLESQAMKEATGLGQYIGPDAYKQFMSPYQEEVIKATEAGLQREKQKALAGMTGVAVGAGAFGGAREGIQRAEYGAAQDVQAQQLLSQLRQTGFQQAQQSALQNLQAAQGLGGYQASLGGTRRGIEQAELTAQREAAREAAFEPFTRLGLVGQQIASLTPGALPSQVQTFTAPAAPASPFATGLGVASGIAGIGTKLGLFG